MKEVIRIVQAWLSRDHTRLALGIGIFSAGLLGYSIGILRHAAISEIPITMKIVPPQETQVEGGSILGSMSEKTEAPLVAIKPENSTAPCRFVGSKNSTLYHLPHCAAAKRIKEANKVCFGSEDDAQGKGYKPGCLK